MSADLAGWTILVAEDEYLVALDVCRSLEVFGAAVVGPAPRVRDAMALAGAPGRLDAAVLDINLAGELIYPVASALMTRGVPIVFVTGYDMAAIPRPFSDVVRCEKPVEPERLVAALREARGGLAA